MLLTLRMEMEEKINISLVKFGEIWIVCKILKNYWESQIFVVVILVVVWVIGLIHLIIRVSLPLLIFARGIMICVFVSLSFFPITYIHYLVSILVYSQPLLLILHELTVVHVILRLPFQSQAVFATLIEIFGLPASQISLAVEVPDQADVPGNYHGAVGVSLYD